MSESNRIVVEPMTRLEGHAKITLDLTGGQVRSCRFHIIESPRFFEKFLEGVPAEEAPQLSERICGICSVAHHLASVKAVEDAWGVTPTKQAVKLRQLENFGGYIHSHTLHLVYLALPDFLVPENPNVVALAAKDPRLAKKGIELRMFGQRIIQALGGRMIHPATVVPGGMAHPLNPEDAEKLLKEAPKALSTARQIVKLYFDLAKKEVGRVGYYARHSTHFLALHRNGTHELYDGTLRFIRPDGTTLRDFQPSDYTKHIAEDAMPHTIVKYPFIRDLGPKEGNYRVGPLARLNVASQLPSPEAQGFAEQLFDLFGGRPILDPMAYNLARAIEALSAVEQAIPLLEDSTLQEDDYRAPAEPRAGDGVGVVEAPRGTLFHHYQTNDQGIITRANLIVATAQNIRTLEQDVIAKAHDLLPQLLKPAPQNHQALQELEIAVRAYDLCISCSVHLIEIVTDAGRFSLNRL